MHVIRYLPDQSAQILWPREELEHMTKQRASLTNWNIRTSRKACSGATKLTETTDQLVSYYSDNYSLILKLET